MRNWYAVRSKPRQEREAANQLENQGFIVWLPLIECSRRRKGRWRDVVEPLFPRYLFIHLDFANDNVAPIRSTRGVTGLVRFGDDPISVPDAVIDGLRSTADPQTGLHHLGEGAFVQGETVAVIEGPFEGLRGIFQMEKGADRALVLLDVLGRESSVTLRRSSLSRD